MEIISVLSIIISGASISSAFGRLVLNWDYDAIVVATLVVTFGVGGMALIVLSKLGLNGVVLTLVAAILLTFVFVKFNFKVITKTSESRRILGCVYWAVLLTIFTAAGLKSGSIYAHINQVYSLGENVSSFVYTLCLFVMVGGLSMLMLMHECRRVER